MWSLLSKLQKNKCSLNINHLTLYLCQCFPIIHSFPKLYMQVVKKNSFPRLQYSFHFYEIHTLFPYSVDDIVPHTCYLPTKTFNSLKGAVFIYQGPLFRAYKDSKTPAKILKMLSLCLKVTQYLTNHLLLSPPSRNNKNVSW